jgi:hypothetical protein
MLSPTKYDALLSAIAMIKQHLLTFNEWRQFLGCGEFLIENLGDEKPVLCNKHVRIDL